MPGTIAHPDELWHACYEDLMTQARIRLEQEVARLGGHYAHVLDEVIHSRRDEVTGEACCGAVSRVCALSARAEIGQRAHPERIAAVFARRVIAAKREVRRGHRNSVVSGPAGDRRETDDP
jgi:hypothetical protein